MTGRPAARGDAADRFCSRGAGPTPTRPAEGEPQTPRPAAQVSGRTRGFLHSAGWAHRGLSSPSTRPYLLSANCMPSRARGTRLPCKGPWEAMSGYLLQEAHLDWASSP